MLLFLLKCINLCNALFRPGVSGRGKNLLLFLLLLPRTAAPAFCGAFRRRRRWRSPFAGGETGGGLRKFCGRSAGPRQECRVGDEKSSSRRPSSCRGPSFGRPSSRRGPSFGRSSSCRSASFGRPSSCRNPSFGRSVRASSSARYKKGTAIYVISCSRTFQHWLHVKIPEEHHTNFTWILKVTIFWVLYGLTFSILVLRIQIRSDPEPFRTGRIWVQFQALGLVTCNYDIKIYKKIFSVLFSVFGHQNPGSGFT
jgi:hypothetical protein